MRDSRRIRERHEDGPSGRFGVMALVALGLVVVSYNVGLQVGISRAVPQKQRAAPAAAPLAQLDQAQQEHDAMQFYTRLNQEAPKPSVEPVQAETTPEPARAPVAMQSETADSPSKAEENTLETAQVAIARLGKSVSAAAVEPKTESIPSPGNFTVQVSAFQTEEEAEAYKASLNRKGYHPYVVAAEIPGKGMWYRVRVGRFEDKNSAIETKAELALVNIPSFIVAAQ